MGIHVRRHRCAALVVCPNAAPGLRDGCSVCIDAPVHDPGAIRPSWNELIHVCFLYQAVFIVGLVRDVLSVRTLLVFGAPTVSTELSGALSTIFELEATTVFNVQTEKKVSNHIFVYPLDTTHCSLL